MHLAYHIVICIEEIIIVVSCDEDFWFPILME
jgi:hypothetical protein